MTWYIVHIALDHRYELCLATTEISDNVRPVVLDLTYMHFGPRIGNIHDSDLPRQEVQADFQVISLSGLFDSPAITLLQPAMRKAAVFTDHDKYHFSNQQSGQCLA